MSDELDIDFIVNTFNELIPNPVCELEYSSEFELLVAVILSAQCTDKRVNMVTRELFKVANKPEDFVNMSQQELEERIHSCGFYHNKAKNIREMSRNLIDKFGGVVPNTIEELVTLSGVGRKTANVIISEAFKGNALAVDTHVLRVANRLGLVNTNEPDVCELKLKSLFNENDWSRLHFQMVLFGRYTCKSKNPNCEGCKFRQICTYYASKETDKN